MASSSGSWILAAVGLAVAALGYVTTTGWAQETSRRTAKRLIATSEAVAGVSGR